MNDVRDRPSRRMYPGWDYVIRSYDEKGRFCLETTHRGDHSRDMELDAIKRCGRTSSVWPVGRDGKVQG